MSAARTSGRAALAVLLFGTAYLPLEEFLLKWAPGGALGYAVFRLAFEALLYAAVASVAAARLVRGLRLRATPIDAPLAAFVALAACSLFLSQGSLVSGLVNLRVLLRYVAVYYLAAWLELGALERRRVLSLLLVSAALQGALGFVQHLQGGASEFWLPRPERIEVGGVAREFAAAHGGLEQGAVIGTTDHSVAFALFLLVAGTLAGALYLAGAARGRLERALLGGVLLLAVGGIVFSYVRACLFALAIALVFLAWSERRGAPLRRLAPVLLLLAPLGVAALLLEGGGGVFVREQETRVSPLASVEALFTSEYLQSAESSRLWVLRDVGGAIARSAGWLGFGPDEEHVKDELLRTGGAALHRMIAYRAFEDVYWVALLAYYGFLGLAAFLVLLARLGPAAWRQRAAARDPWERAAAATLLALLGVVVPLGFLEPTFDFRTFAFYFWLLAGLVTVRATPRASPAPKTNAPPARAVRPAGAASPA